MLTARVYPSCPDCKTKKYVVEDTRNGRITCSNCGLVVKNTLLYEQSEWRNFSDKDGTNKADPNRIGGFFDPLLSDGANLATFIGNSDGGNRLQRLNQMNNLSAMDRKKFHTSSIINTYGQRMSFPQNVKLMARDLVNQILEGGELNGKNKKALVASILYISAKCCRAPRPLKELCAVMDVKRKEVSRIYSDIMKLKAKGKVKIQTYNTSSANTQESDAEMFAEKFARVLELPSQVIHAVKQTAKNIHKLDMMHSHQPSTVAACVIYAVLQVKPHENQRKTELIAEVCQVSERNFVQQFRRTIIPKLLDLIPENYATPEEISALDL